MSDEPIRIPDDARMPRRHGIVEHWCEHPGCDRWGSFGFHRGRANVWYCGEHRDEGEREQRPAT